MNIIAKAKPVRIRVVSGGEEHFSLDSLCNNLSVQDIFPLIKDGRLSRWLNQLGKDNLSKDLKDKTNRATKLEDRIYLDILRIFLGQKVNKFKTVSDLRTLYSCWHDDSKLKESKTFVALQKYLLESLDGIEFLHQKYQDEIEKQVWWDAFEKHLDIPQILYWQGLLAYNGFTKEGGDNGRSQGVEKIKRAADCGYSEAKKFVEDNVWVKYQEVSQSKKFVEDNVWVKYQEVSPSKKFVENNVWVKYQKLSQSKKEDVRWLIKQWRKNNYNVQVHEGYYKDVLLYKVNEFLSWISIFYKSPYSLEAEARAEAIKKQIDKSDVFYKEKKLIYALYLEWRWKGYKEAILIYKNLRAEYNYPLASEMLRGQLNWTRASFKTQIIHVVEHLVDY